MDYLTNCNVTSNIILYNCINLYIIYLSQVFSVVFDYMFCHYIGQELTSINHNDQLSHGWGLWVMLLDVTLTMI